jgi:hypothetical protein
LAIAVIGIGVVLIWASIQHHSVAGCCVRKIVGRLLTCDVCAKSLHQSSMVNFDKAGHVKVGLYHVTIRESTARAIAIIAPSQSMRCYSMLHVSPRKDPTMRLSKGSRHGPRYAVKEIPPVRLQQPLASCRHLKDSCTRHQLYSDRCLVFVMAKHPDSQTTTFHQAHQTSVLS